MHGLTKDDGALIAFVRLCFFSGAIDHAELRCWSLKMIGEIDKYPLYLLDLMDFTGPRFHINEIIGFTSSADYSEETYRTIDQIAFHRKGITTNAISKQDLEAASWVDPMVVERFNRVFQGCAPRLDPETPSPINKEALCHTDL